MEFLGNLFKGIGLLLLALIVFIIWAVTGPHSYEEVVKGMKEYKKKAESAESAGENFISQGYINGIDNPSKCRNDFNNAFYSYLDAHEYWVNFSNYADKLGNWEQTKQYQRGAKAVGEKKLQDLEGKIKHSRNPPCK